MKKIVKLTESELQNFVKEIINETVNDKYDEHYKMTCLSALHDLVERHGAQYVMTRLGNEIGWRRMSGAIQLAFSGGGDSYERRQETRSPYGE